MKKRVFGRKLGRDRNQKKALFRNLICSLFEQGKIVTTLAKAKAIKGKAEKLITKAKKGSLADRRAVARFLNNRFLVNKLVDGIAPVLKERSSGYLRVVRVGTRKGDLAKMALIGFVDDIGLVQEKASKAKPKMEEVAKKKITKGRRKSLSSEVSEKATSQSAKIN